MSWMRKIELIPMDHYIHSSRGTERVWWARGKFEVWRNYRHKPPKWSISGEPSNRFALQRRNFKSPEAAMACVDKYYPEKKP